MNVNVDEAGKNGFAGGFHGFGVQGFGIGAFSVIDFGDLAAAH
jgi:hypothetical protein